MNKKIIVVIITIGILFSLSIAAFIFFNKSDGNQIQPKYHPIQPKACALKCDNYHYSTCPDGCIKECRSSACSGNMCTADCEGKGSCTCP